jgi:hypothetical protein
MAELIFIIENSDRVKNISNNYISIINNILNVCNVLKPEIPTSVILMNEDIKYIYFRTKINDIDKINMKYLNPVGKFKLYDNFSGLLNRFKQFQNKTKSGSAIVIFLTIDKDNSSVRLNERLTWLQVTINKSCNWRFIFLSHSHDNFEIGKNIGFDSCIQYDFTNNDLDAIAYTIEYLIKNDFQEKLNLNTKDIFKLL